MKKRDKIFNTGPLTVASPEAMGELGVAIGRLLEPGDILAITGDLGAGKTHLAQGIMKGLGASDPASSPTFSIVHEHTDGRIPAYHFDFYRLKGEHELYAIGWEDFLERDGVMLVEWADMFPGALPPDAVWLRITHEGERTRRVERIH